MPPSCLFFFRCHYLLVSRLTSTLTPASARAFNCCSVAVTVLCVCGDCCSESSASAGVTDDVDLRGGMLVCLCCASVSRTEGSWSTWGLLGDGIGLDCLAIGESDGNCLNSGFGRSRTVGMVLRVDVVKERWREVRTRNPRRGLRAVWDLDLGAVDSGRVLHFNFNCNYSF